MIVRYSNMFCCSHTTDLNGFEGIVTPLSSLNRRRQPRTCHGTSTTSATSSLSASPFQSFSKGSGFHAGTWNGRGGCRAHGPGLVVKDILDYLSVEHPSICCEEWNQSIWLAYQLLQHVVLSWQRQNATRGSIQWSVWFFFFVWFQRLGLDQTWSVQIWQLWVFWILKSTEYCICW